MVKFTKKYTKKRPMTKKTSYKKKSRTAKIIAPKDTTVVKYNPGKDKVVKFIKSPAIFYPYTLGTSGSNALQFSGGASAITAFGSVQFDPAGSFGTYSGTVSVNGTFVGAPAPVVDWGSLIRLYSHYKVTKIVCKFTAQDTGSLISAPPIIYMRYANVYPSVTPNISTVSEQRGWVRKTFTPEHPNFTYAFYPKVMMLADNIGVLATEARQPKNMPWTNCSTPVDLYGFQFIYQFPANTTTTDTFVNMDVEYHLCFKTAN